MATQSSILGLKNPMDRGAWRATVLNVTESDRTEATAHTYTETRATLSSLIHWGRVSGSGVSEGN